MENWIGVAVWIILGGVIGLVARIVIKLPEEAYGHTLLIVILGAFGALVGGMLGVGLLHFDEPLALSLGGMLGAVFLSLFMTILYRWGVRGWIPRG